MAVLHETLGTIGMPRKKKNIGNIFPVPPMDNPFLKQIRGSDLNRALVQKSARPMTAPIEQPVSYESDPVLQRIRALGQQNVANARSEAAAARKQAIIDSGLYEFAPQDPNTMTAAKQNPFSSAAMLLRAFAQQERQLNEDADNLFYSGTRMRGLEDLGFERARQQQLQTRNLRDLLAGIDREVLSAEEAAAAQEAEAIRQAAEVARQTALQQALVEQMVSAAPDPLTLGGVSRGFTPPRLSLPAFPIRPPAYQGRSIFDPIFGL